MTRHKEVIQSTEFYVYRFLCIDFCKIEIYSILNLMFSNFFQFIQCISLFFSYSRNSIKQTKIDNKKEDRD